MSTATPREGEPVIPALDPALLAILRCPLTLSTLHQEGNWLVAAVGGLRYPIRDGLPVMLAEEAALPDGVGSLEAFRTLFKVSR
jgi:uncharacterized protein